MSAWRTLVADDEPQARARLKALLAAQPELELVAQAASGPEALDRLTRGDLDLAFLDIDLPGMTGLEVARAARASGRCDARIVFVTGYASHGAEAYELEAVDYLVKPVSEARLSRAVERLRAFDQGSRRPAGMAASLGSRFGLTAREAELCELVKQGLVREQIQDRLGLSAGTMKTHLGHIYDKVGLEGDDQGRGDKYSRLLYLLFTLE